MKIRFAPSTGCPYGQFIVTAETDEDVAIMASFLSPSSMSDKTGKGWQFMLHGYGYKSSDNGPYNFNFGWCSTNSGETKP